MSQIGAWRGPLSPFCAALALAGHILLAANSSWAEDRTSVDTRSGTVRIYISVATSAATRLVTALKAHFPNLKIEFVRAGSVETVRRFVAERQAGRIGADLIHGADPGGFEYFAQKGWLDKRLVAPTTTKDYRDGFFNANAGWVALRATGIAPMYNTSHLEGARRAQVEGAGRDLRPDARGVFVLASLRHVEDVRRRLDREVRGE
jgi:hypothetical protein